MHMMIRKR